MTELLKKKNAVTTVSLPSSISVGKIYCRAALHSHSRWAAQWGRRRLTRDRKHSWTQHINVCAASYCTCIFALRICVWQKTQNAEVEILEERKHWAEKLVKWRILDYSINSTPWYLWNKMIWRWVFCALLKSIRLSDGCCLQCCFSTVGQGFKAAPRKF